MRIQQAADLLKMLEIVFQAGSAERGNSFPWDGVRLTLGQAREILEDEIESIEPDISEITVAQRSEPQKQVANAPRRTEAYTRTPPPRTRETPKETLPNSAEAPFRGTFNRIQLTEESVETREERTGTVK